MTRTGWRNLSLVPWLILPVMLIRYWQLQDGLPARIAVHFNLNNVPNGWSDSGSFVFGFLGMTVGVLALFTVLSFLPRRTSEFTMVLLIVEYITAAVICLAFVGVLEYNALSRADVLHIAGRVALLTPIIAIAAVLYAMLRTGRDVSQQLRGKTNHGAIPAVPPSKGRRLAEEAQRAPVAALLFTVLTVFLIFMVVKFPPPAIWIRVLLISLSIVMAWLVIHAWGGFRYVVTTTGVEVRSGGIRMCSIAKPEIQEYRVAECDPLSDFGGWGWRWVPGKQAFIWHGHEAVRIRTARRDFYLGHDQPERLVRDLDVMMKSV